MICKRESGDCFRRRKLQQTTSRIDTGGGGHNRSNSKKQRGGSFKSRHRNRPPNLQNLEDCANESGAENNSPSCASDTSDESASASEAGQHRRKGSGRFSEYEITLMWNQCKMNFPSGRVNSVQLSQLLQQVMQQLPTYTYCMALTAVFMHS